MLKTGNFVCGSLRVTLDDSNEETFIVLLRLLLVVYPFSKFRDEFSSFLSLAATISHEFIITGDYNIHLDNPTDALTSQFLSVLFSFNLTQHVDFPTRDKNHILDLVITSSDSSLAPSLSTSHWSPSDHFPIFTKLCRQHSTASSKLSFVPPFSLNRH